MSIPGVINNQQDYHRLITALGEAEQTDDAQLKYRVHDAALSTLNKALENGSSLPSSVNIQSLRVSVAKNLDKDKFALIDEFIAVCKSKNFEPADLLKEMIIRDEFILKVEGSYGGELVVKASGRILFPFDQLQDQDLYDILESASKLIFLKSFELYGFNIPNVPNGITNLSKLEKISLCNNKIKNIPENIGDLKNLKKLHLSYNELTDIPESVGEIKMLEEFFSFGNKHTNFPETICKLSQLKRLGLAENELTNIPEGIGNLKRLEEFEIHTNSIATLPSSILNLSPAVMSILNLARNPILPRSNSPNEVGYTELTEHFGDRFVFDRPAKMKAMDKSTTKEDVYSELNSKPFRINREQFAKIKIQEIDVKKVMNCDEMLKALEQILSDVNTTDPNQSGYFSYDTLRQERTEGTNKEKIEKIVIPRLRGYIKTLYRVPLSQEDMIPSMMMYEKLIPATQKALTFIFDKLLEEEDPDILSIRFSQLTIGLLHCMTGQSEAINILAYSMLDPLQRVSGSKTHIFDIVATEKNQWFTSTILSKAAENTQNVHLISYYRDQLGDELGLTAAVKGFTEEIGVIGTDPFIHNSANVLKVFYNLVTPQRILDWVEKKTQRTSDRQSIINLQTVEKLASKRKDVNEEQLVGLRKMLDKVSGYEKTQIKRRIDQLQNPSDLTNEEIGHLEAIAKAIGVDDVLSEDRTFLTDDGRQRLLNALRKKVKEEAIQRPITTGQMIQLMVDEKIIDPNDMVWKGLLTANPEDPLSEVTREGIKKVLIAIDVLIDEEDES